MSSHTCGHQKEAEKVFGKSVVECFSDKMGGIYTVVATKVSGSELLFHSSYIAEIERARAHGNEMGRESSFGDALAMIGFRIDFFFTPELRNTYEFYLHACIRKSICFVQLFLSHACTLRG